jgi:RNA polymerase subunit RPABC4/transcription elongation factor Spt4
MSYEPISQHSSEKINMSVLFHERRRRISLSMADIGLLHLVLEETFSATDPAIVDLKNRLLAVFLQEADPDFVASVDAYRNAVQTVDGEMEIDNDAEVSMGEDPGAYVMIWKWVSAEDAGVCRSCHTLYSDGGDGYDGECPDCADKTEAARDDACEACGNTLNDGSDICDQCGGSFVSPPCDTSKEPT